MYTLNASCSSSSPLLSYDAAARRLSQRLPYRISPRGLVVGFYHTPHSARLGSARLLNFVHWLFYLKKKKNENLELGKRGNGGIDGLDEQGGKLFAVGRSRSRRSSSNDQRATIWSSTIWKLPSADFIRRHLRRRWMVSGVECGSKLKHQTTWVGRSVGRSVISCNQSIMDARSKMRLGF